MNSKTSKGVCLVCVILMGLTGAYAGAEEVIGEESPVIEIPGPEKKPLVQMAILLDTSGSMSGLIDQARAELWSIVNEFITAERNGKVPEMQVALFEYGKSTLPGDEGFIRLIAPFTTDLDNISEGLFALHTNGGDEYCGWVIQEAVNRLQWSKVPDDLKVIFIAGNEPFTQGPVPYQQSCKTAIEKGIIVNTIHCGSAVEGTNGKWHQGAVLADGRYLNIDQNQQIVHIASPQDQEIARLNERLNQTYIAYGALGRARKDTQMEQDKNAQGLSLSSLLQRAVTKSSSNYDNRQWDLVDAVQQDPLKLEELADEALPREMQDMNDTEKRAFIEQKTQERQEIQRQIQELHEQRQKYIAEQTKNHTTDDNTLGSAIIQAIRAQAQKKHYTFKNSPAAEGTNGSSHESN